jgi:hypothetical protein
MLKIYLYGYLTSSADTSLVMPASICSMRF